MLCRSKWKNLVFSLGERYQDHFLSGKVRTALTQYLSIDLISVFNVQTQLVRSPFSQNGLVPFIYDPLRLSLDGVFRTYEDKSH